MANFDLRTFLTENKLTRVSKTLNENIESTDSVKLFDFPEDLKDVKAYEQLGFNVEIDDPANRVYSAELSFKGYDWMSVLSVLEDAASYGLYPNLEYNGETYEYKEARELTDQKAAVASYEDPNGSGGVNEIANTFDLRTFLTENKLTRVSKTLVTEAMSMNDLDSMKIVTDEYLAQKGIKVNPTENGSGQRVLDMLNPPHVSTIETDEDEAGAESYDVYDLGDGHFLVIDDYEGQFGIYRKVEGIKAAGGMNEAPANKTSEDKLPTIKISKDIYYFDKLGRLDTKDNVDEKYHNRADLIFKKGQTIKDDTKYEDSDYKMITSSTSLEKGIDYSDDGKAAGGMNEAPANEAITEGDSFDYSNLILSTINSLTDMGEEGENALRVLGKISDWNEVVRLATEE